MSDDDKRPPPDTSVFNPEDVPGKPPRHRAKEKSDLPEDIFGKIFVLSGMAIVGICMAGIALAFAGGIIFLVLKFFIWLVGIF